MANDDCCAKQLIDDNDEFNIAGLDNFNRTINLASCGLLTETDEMHRSFVRYKTLISVASNRIFSSRPTSLKQQEASHSSDSNNGNTSFRSLIRFQKANSFPIRPSYGQRNL
ncbi:hypothetical protein JHK87_055203 [Glycine soja]|nr:hypothetical protein JHK87_055203 [Glycine soja]